MTRTEFLNMLIAMNGYKTYLEIGIQKAENNFAKINAAIKISVDPDEKSDATIHCTSDQFFDTRIKAAKGFDLIFIDGLHHSDQVERDIINSIEILNYKGTIVLHDCNPKEYSQQLVPRETKIWYGDVWRAFVGFRLKNPDEITFCLNHDCGLGVIVNPGKNIKPGFVTDMPWEEFDKNRKQLLGII